MGKQWKWCQTLFSWAPKSLQVVTAAMKLKTLLLGSKVMTNLDSILKSRDIPLPTKVWLVKGITFPVVMYGCENWTTKKAEHGRTDAFELWCWRRLLRVLDCKEIQPVHPKGNQSWIFIGKTDDEAETPILWPPDAMSWLIGKDPDDGKDWRQEEKWATEDGMVGWHHRLDGQEFEQIPGVVIDREAWHAAAHGVTKGQTWVSDWTELILPQRIREMQGRSRRGPASHVPHVTLFFKAHFPRLLQRIR